MPPTKIVYRNYEEQSRKSVPVHIGNSSEIALALLLILILVIGSLALLVRVLA